MGRFRVGSQTPLRRPRSGADWAVGETAGWQPAPQGRSTSRFIESPSDCRRDSVYVVYWQRYVSQKLRTCPSIPRTLSHPCNLTFSPHGRRLAARHGEGWLRFARWKPAGYWSNCPGTGPTSDLTKFPLFPGEQAQVQFRALRRCGRGSWGRIAFSRWAGWIVSFHCAVPTAASLAGCCRQAEPAPGH